LLAAAAAIACANGSAQAREPRLRVDLSATTLSHALAELSRESATSIGTEGPLPDIRTPGVHGEMSVGEALARLLAHSDYTARQVGPTAWRIVRRTPAPGLLEKRVPAVPSVAVPPLDAMPAEPIIVTGGKRVQSLADLPMAISVVQPAHYRPFDPAAGTSWLSSEVEGMVLTNLGPGRNSIFLRGIADSPFNGDSQSTVAVVLDEERLTYSAPDPDIRLVDVDRVEVLKGPQGALYGTGALGGVYHIVSNRPDFEKASLTVSTGGEVVAAGGLGASGSTVVNLPLRPGSSALRLVGYAAHEAGWVDTGSRRNANASSVVGIRSGLGFDLADGWRLDLTAFGQWLNSADSQYAYRPGARTRPAQGAEPHDNDLRHFAGRLAKHEGSLDIVISSALTWHEVNDRFDATVGADSFGVADPRFLTDVRSYRVWDTEARIANRIGAFNWLIGLSHITARQGRDVALAYGAADGSLAIDAERRSFSDTAVFGDLTAPITNTLRLSLGARVFHSVVSQSGSVFSTITTDERRRDGITPGASLMWNPRRGRTLFLRYASAIRQGVIGIDAAGSTAPLKDDELSTIEAGWREDVPGVGHVEIGAYFTLWENLQSDILLTDGLIGTRTAGNARIVGLEASFEAKPLPGWTLQGGMSLIQSQLVTNALGFAVDDRRLPVIPEYTLRGAVEHGFVLAGKPAAVRMQLRYLGPARLGFDPALDRPMGRVLESSLHGSVDLGRFTVGADISNIFGGSGNTFSLGNPLRFPLQHQFTPQKPTSFSVGVTGHF
jgi:outer membrane receptor protein involved in Fe transport